MSDLHRYAAGLVYEALGCPFPANGTQSVSVRGLSSYASDMREIVPLCRSIVLAMSVGQNYRGEIRELCESLRVKLERQQARKEGGAT